MRRVDFILLGILTKKNLSRERIKRLNDFKIRLDRVGSFLKDVEQVRSQTSFYNFNFTSNLFLPRLQNPNLKLLLQSFQHFPYPYLPTLLQHKSLSMPHHHPIHLPLPNFPPRAYSLTLRTQTTTTYHPPSSHLHCLRSYPPTLLKRRSLPLIHAPSDLPL